MTIKFHTHAIIVDEEGNELQRVRLPNVRTFMFDYLRRYVTDLNYQMSTNEISTNLFEKIWSYDCELMRVNLSQLKSDCKRFRENIWEREVFEVPELGYDEDGIRTVREEIVDVIDEIIATMKDYISDDLQNFFIVIY